VEEQIIKGLKEHAAGLSAGDVCRKYGISDAMFYKWRSRYGGIEIAVTNKSELFDIKNLGISCHFIVVKTDANNTFNDGYFRVMGGPASVEAGKSRPYTCIFSRIFGLGSQKFVEAKIEFVGEYASPWPWPFNGQRRFKTDIFTLNPRTDPPRWMEGTPLD
jgi:putative transposase